MLSDSCSLTRCDFYCQIIVRRLQVCSKETPARTVDVWKSLLKYTDLKGSVLRVYRLRQYLVDCCYLGMIQLALHYLLSEQTVSHPVSPQLRTLWSRSRLLEPQGGRLNGNKSRVFPRASELKLTVCACVCMSNKQMCLRYLTHLRVASPHLFAVITLQCSALLHCVLLRAYSSDIRASLQCV